MIIFVTYTFGYLIAKIIDEEDLSDYSTDYMDRGTKVQEYLSSKMLAPSSSFSTPKLPSLKSTMTQSYEKDTFNRNQDLFKRSLNLSKFSFTSYIFFSENISSIKSLFLKNIEF